MADFTAGLADAALGVFLGPFVGGLFSFIGEAIRVVSCARRRRRAWDMKDVRLEERDSKPVHCAMLRDVGARTGLDMGVLAVVPAVLPERLRICASARLPMQASGISCWHRK